MLWKEARLEWRTRGRLSALAGFSFTTLLVFSFALGPDIATLRRATAGYLWLSILLSSVLALSESFRVESENGALDGLRLVPIDLRALFLGKALANSAVLWLLGAILTPIACALYDSPLDGGIARLLLTLLLGAAGIAAPGTMYAAIAANAKARDVLLPLLLFPILIPTLVVSVKATGLVLHGDPQTELGSWLAISAAFDVLYWSLGFLLFPRIAEDD